MAMTEIRPAANADAARWLLRADVDWWDLVRYGPPGFDVYVRIAFAQDADGVDPAGEQPALRVALATLASYTATPASGYAAIWEGWISGDLAPQAPRVPIPHRAMLLFTGPVGVQRRTRSGLVRLRAGLSRTAPRVARRSGLVPGLRGRRGDRVHRGMLARRVPSFGSSPVRCCPTGALRGTGTAVPRPRLARAIRSSAGSRALRGIETRSACRSVAWERPPDALRAWCPTQKEDVHGQR
jgi:hypothetical protein